MVGSPATNKSPKTKIRQHEAFACSNYRQEPDDDDDEVAKDGEENQDELAIIGANASMNILQATFQAGE